VQLAGLLGNALKLKIAQPPEDNKANKAVIQFLAKLLATIDSRLKHAIRTGTVRSHAQPIARLDTGAVTGELQRPFTTVLGDIFQNSFPAWTAGLNISYPIGHSQAEAELAKARLQTAQQRAQLRNQQLQVSTQVREAARQVVTNQKRVGSTGAARNLAERRLDAEQRKLAAGTSTNFVVFQTQRDLAVARNNELKAILDFAQSVVDLETVQEVPLTPTAGAGAATTTAAR